MVSAPSCLSHLAVPAIITEDFSIADDLLDALGRRNLRWEGRPLDWYFRGQADASWSLVPAALRPEGAFAYGPRKVLSLADTHGRQEMAEATVLAEFLSQLDLQGLAPPQQDVDGFNSFVAAAEKLAFSREPWPHRDLRPALALAQHHGVPTRLLDWSTKPLVAAYFGAREAAERARNVAKRPEERSKVPDRFAVWALNGLVFALFGMGDLKIETVKPPRHSNPNLRAQEGILTVLIDESRQSDDPAWFPPLDEAIRDLGEHASVKVRTFLRKMTLPTSEAGRLLRLLDQEGVSGTHLFPGVDGAVRGLRERGLWGE